MTKMLQKLKSMVSRDSKPKPHDTLRPIDPNRVGDITTISAIEQLNEAKRAEKTHA